MFKQYGKLIIKCEENIHESIFNSFCEKVFSNFERIDNFFNANYNELSLLMVSKENLNKLVKERSSQYKEIDIPKWLVGFSDFNEVLIVIPTESTLEEMANVAIHELVHLLSFKLNTTNKRIKLLDEGIAVYLSNQSKGKIYTPWVNAYFKNNIPKLSDFCTYDSIEFNNKRRISILPYYY